MMIEAKQIKTSDLPAILEVTESLSAWFDADARGRAIPLDLLNQKGFVALSEGENAKAIL